MALIAPLAVVLALMTATMMAAWLTQRAANNSGWIDVFWTYATGACGVIAAAWPADGAAPARQMLAAALMAVWALRLGTYIALRVRGSDREDARYARFRKDWGQDYQARIFWLTLPQAAITTVMMASVFVAAHREGPLGLRDAAAALVLLVAIGGETLADWQLARFKRSHPKAGAVNDTGLWGWSRHPNYFFEWFGWLAWPVMALDPTAPVTWLTLLAPAMMFVVLRFITGVPPLEATMLESRGAAFREYQRRTSTFFLLPPRKV